MKRINFFIIVGVLLAWIPQSRAKLDGFNQEVPPAAVLFVSLPPENPDPFADEVFLNNDHQSQSFPLGTNFNALIYPDGFLGFCVFDPQGFSGQPAISTGFPYLWTVSINNTGLAASTAPYAQKKAEDNLELGTVQFWPLMLGRIQNNFAYEVRVAVNSPEDQFGAGSPDMAGPGYSTVEPDVGVGWLNSKTGIEASIFSGIGFNAENATVDYRSGDFVHMDTTVAKHVPFLGGMAGVGINGFYWKQINADDASGTSVVSFRRKSDGVGPLIFYVRSIGKKQFTFETKWLPKVDVKDATVTGLVRVEVALLF